MIVIGQRDSKHLNYLISFPDKFPDPCLPFHSKSIFCSPTGFWQCFDTATRLLPGMSSYPSSLVAVVSCKALKAPSWSSAMENQNFRPEIGVCIIFNGPFSFRDLVTLNSVDIRQTVYAWHLKTPDFNGFHSMDLRSNSWCPKFCASPSLQICELPCKNLLQKVEPPATMTTCEITALNCHHVWHISGCQL